MTHTRAETWSVFEEPLVDPITGTLVTGARVDLEWFNLSVAAAELRTLCLTEPWVPRVVVRLGEERFVDLRGLRVLVEASLDAQAWGRRLLVVAPPGSLLRMIRLLRAEGVLEIVELDPLTGAERPVPEGVPGSTTSAARRDLVPRRARRRHRLTAAWRRRRRRAHVRPR